MPDAFTPELDLVKPEVGGSIDTWGTKTNVNWDKLDAAHLAEVAARAQAIEELADLFVGMLAMFPSPSAKAGWLVCAGQAVSRTTYAKLFAYIGTTYGNGNGTTTFNLPDYRGEFMRGYDAGRGVDPGRGINSFQGDQNKSHNHGNTNAAGGHSHNGAIGSAGYHSHSGSANANGNHRHYVAMRQASSGGEGDAGDANDNSIPGTTYTNYSGNHIHSLSINGNGAHVHSISIYSVGNHAHVIPNDGGSEVRVRNKTALICIKT